MKRTPNNTGAVLLALVIGISFFVPAHGSASQDPVAGLLVRMQFAFEEFGVRTDSEGLFYRDGLVITRGMVDGIAYYYRGSLSPGDLASLRRLLNENHVGLIVAPPGCQMPSPLPNTASMLGSSLTWFGKNGRQNHMSIGGGDEGCPVEFINLFLGIYDLHVNDTDAVTTVP